MATADENLAFHVTHGFWMPSPIGPIQVIDRSILGSIDRLYLLTLSIMGFLFDVLFEADVFARRDINIGNNYVEIDYGKMRQCFSKFTMHYHLLCIIIYYAFTI